MSLFHFTLLLLIIKGYCYVSLSLLISKSMSEKMFSRTLNYLILKCAQELKLEILEHSRKIMMLVWSPCACKSIILAICLISKHK